MNRLNLWLIIIFTILALAVFAYVSGKVYAEEPKETVTPTSPSMDDPAIRKSIEHMLKRAQLTRTLAAEHLIYIKENRDTAIIRLIEDATQVMAFNLICEDEKIEARELNQIAADVSFKVAMMAGNSSISEQLARIASQQTVNERMELIGDISTTVLMFEVGRRRGLFDALMTDFGKPRFCSGMEGDMRTRYNALVTGLGG
ncbi:hypothetical protein [Kordiimonas pumila]|uniref:Uncharacterized protein n=1 Tax=Kordiimonas pumila TaxID=2161677 RepID=A0ABV7D8U9_9PROT|nr:hypothetical protein [Kordiimonas pumila]